ncbi:MAG: DUF4125 family protein [Oscillospiraceae bacterium]|nr:DUF4125 family protein [Oscillospiraceae bacterium]
MKIIIMSMETDNRNKGMMKMDTNQAITEKIIATEWEMFIAVNEGEERASCQEDAETFGGMRRAQYDAWSDETRQAYLDDLEAAKQAGRNLVEEKYIHMMQTTEPSKYEALLPRVKLPTEAALSLAKDVSDMLLEQTRLLFEDYPYVSGHGRPLYSELDYGYTSVETYQLCELYTYSEATLAALKKHIRALADAGGSLARMILENTVRYYGYESLDTAEAATKARVDKLGIQVSFGCCADEECEL